MKLINLNKIQDSDIGLVGGKALSLAKMIRSGIPVPDGFVVTTEHWNYFLEDNNLKEKIEKLLSVVDLEKSYDLNDVSNKIKDLILGGSISEEVAEEIGGVFENLQTDFVAVRSSAVVEDGALNTWAGQFESYLNVSENKIIEYIKKCWASVYSPRAIYYKITKKGVGDNWGMSVLIQKMINSESSGVAFSVHPQTKNDKHIYIESCFGLGEALVSGAIIPDCFVVHKDTLEILNTNIAQKDTALSVEIGGNTKWIDVLPEKVSTQSLSDNQLVKLVKTVKLIEEYFGAPSDVEWAYERGTLHILQSRPITA